MARVERDPDDMLRFVKDWDEYSQKISQIARNLSSCCSAARSSLRDEASRKLIDRIEEFEKTLNRTVQQGEQPVRELERSAKTLKRLEDEMR